MTVEKSSNITMADEQFSYDKIPYISYPYPYTRSENLRTVAAMFGLQAPLLEHARILELGCGEGNNLMNFAENYPSSYSLGVDLSKDAITKGQNRINTLKLGNIELKHLSISDLDESLGKFDYIVCHGVLSWVPVEVRTKIFELSKKLLSPSGVAFVSYNTLPGWNMTRTIREMMLYHAKLFGDDINKLQQAKLFLKFVSESLEQTNSPYSQFLKQELDQLLMQGDNYIFHEYLGTENHPFYFNEIIQMGFEHQLNYLGDAFFPEMYLGNLPSKAVEKLQEVKDIIKTGQYMDFIQNKRFRTTLFCHNDVKLSRNITYDTIKDFYSSMVISSEKNPADLDISNSIEEAKFFVNYNQNLTISTSSPIMKAIFYVYAENVNNYLSFGELINLAHKKLNNVLMQDIQNELANSILRLIFMGYIKIRADKPKYVYEISKKPAITHLARLQGKEAGFVTNQLNEIIALAVHEVFVVDMLDGTNSVEKIEEKILGKLINGELSASTDEKPVTDPDNLKVIAGQIVQSTLEKFKLNLLLIK